MTRTSLRCKFRCTDCTRTVCMYVCSLYACVIRLFILLLLLRRLFGRVRGNVSFLILCMYMASFSSFPHHHHHESCALHECFSSFSQIMPLSHPISHINLSCQQRNISECVCFSLVLVLALVLLPRSLYPFSRSCSSFILRKDSI